MMPKSRENCLRLSQSAVAEPLMLLQDTQTRNHRTQYYDHERHLTND